SFGYRLSQTKFDALVMLIFNYPKFSNGGAPKLRRALANGERTGSGYMGDFGYLNEAEIRKEWSDINRAGGAVSPGLVNRRRYELELSLKVNTMGTKFLKARYENTILLILIFGVLSLGCNQAIMKAENSETGPSESLKLAQQDQ